MHMSYDNTVNIMTFIEFFNQLQDLYSSLYSLLFNIALSLLRVPIFH